MAVEGVGRVCGVGASLGGEDAHIQRWHLKQFEKQTMIVVLKTTLLLEVSKSGVLESSLC